MQLTREGSTEIHDPSKTVAVVGLSNTPDRPRCEVARYLQQAGYRILRANPMTDTVLGEKAYKSLRDVAARVDVVQIFRHPSAVPPVLEDVIAIAANVARMQPTAENEEAAARAEAAGLQASWARA
jgi:predicted CoA-binding protein